MTWVKLDDGFYRNRKARLAGKDGRALYIAALCHCSGALTDGHISTVDLGMLCAEADVKPLTAAKLVQVGLWKTVEDGWIVHDFDEYNPPAEQVIAERRIRQEKAKRAAQARWSGDPGDARGNATSMGPSMGPSNARAMPRPVPSRPVPEKDQNPSVYNIESVANEGKSGEDDISPQERDGKLRDLVERLADACTANNRQRVHLEAALVIGLCQPHASLDVLTEAVDDAIAGKPVLPRFLIEAFQRRCRIHGLPAPMLHHEILGRPNAS